MTKLITFGKYKNQDPSELINDKDYYKFVMACSWFKIKYPNDYAMVVESEKHKMNEKENDLPEINFWDLPSDIRVYIFNINKEAERKEWKVNYYEHLNGKVKIFKSIKLKDYYWFNCVSCGCDISTNKNRHHHWCYQCFTKYSPFYYKDGVKVYRKNAHLSDSKPLLRSRPILLGRDKCPLIINDRLVLKPACSEECRYVYANICGDYMADGLILE